MPVDSPRRPAALRLQPAPAHALSNRGGHALTTWFATTLSFACLALASAMALPAHGAEESVASRYRQDMRDCREGRTAQSRPDCEREARNAAGEARRGALKTPIDAAGHAQQRCAVFKDATDHADCMARMGTGARLSGSVEGGGLLREHTTSVPAR